MSKATEGVDRELYYEVVKQRNEAINRAARFEAALKEAIAKVDALGCALHNDGHVVANSMWRLEAELSAVLAQTNGEKSG